MADSLFFYKTVLQPEYRTLWQFFFLYKTVVHSSRTEVYFDRKAAGPESFFQEVPTAWKKFFIIKWAVPVCRHKIHQ